MERYIYEVTLRPVPGGLVSGTNQPLTERWNCYTIEHTPQGRLIIYDKGVARIYGPNEWTSLRLVETIEVPDRMEP